MEVSQNQSVSVFVFQPKTKPRAKAVEIIRKMGGTIRTAGALRNGVHPRTLYKLRDSRMKDFYDIWLLSRQFDFVGEKLAEAIRLTFNRRGTTLPNEIVAFTERFIAAKQIQWKTFTLKLNQEYVPTSFAHIVSVVESLLGPFATAISSGTTVPTIWIAPGPWSKS